MENLVWQRKVAASKNMESLFQKMLIEQYGIHPRPSEFVMRVLGKVFHDDGNVAGQTQVRMKKSFHIKLAPTETISDRSESDHVGGKGKGRGSMDDVDCTASTSTGTGTNSVFSTADATSKPQKQNGIPVTTLKSRPWQDRKVKANRPRNKTEKDEDKKKKSKQEEQDGMGFKSKKTRAGAVKTTATMTASLFKRSHPQDPALSTPVQPALSAKAADILGIPYSELSALTMALSLSLQRETIAAPLVLLVDLEYQCCWTPRNTLLRSTLHRSIAICPT
jgi:hypothetical protein